MTTGGNDEKKVDSAGNSDNAEASKHIVASAGPEIGPGAAESTGVGGPGIGVGGGIGGAGGGLEDNLDAKTENKPGEPGQESNAGTT